MSRKAVIKRGILSNPVNSTYIVTVTKRGVIRINKELVTNVKRPNQYR